MIKNITALLFGAMCCFTLNPAHSETAQTKLNDFVLSSTQIANGGDLPPRDANEASRPKPAPFI